MVEGNITTPFRDPIHVFSDCRGLPPVIGPFDAGDLWSEDPTPCALGSAQSGDLAAGQEAEQNPTRARANRNNGLIMADDGSPWFKEGLRTASNA